MTSRNGRIAPYDLEAEEAIVGAAMLSRGAVTDATATGLTSSDFYKPALGHAWRAVLALDARGVHPDPITIVDQLHTDGHDLPRAELLRIQGDTAGASQSARHYAAIVHRHAIARVALGDAAELVTALTNGQPWAHLATALADHAAEQTTANTDNSWTPADLDDVITRGAISPRPELLARNDGEALLYRGRLHSVAGPPESGKTWLVLHAAAQTLNDGGTVLYLDFEDTVDGIVGRLRDLGVDPATILDGLIYISPHGPLSDQAATQLDALLDARRPDLAIIDGVTEALALWALETNSNDDAAQWMAELPRRITRHGTAVVLVDHVARANAEQTRRRFALGAQHKLAAIDGSAFLVEVIRPFGRGKDGILAVELVKDRQGHLRRLQHGHRIAELHVHANENGTLDLTLKAPIDQMAWRPTVYMERVSRHLEDHGDATGHELELAVRGQAKRIREAITYLVADGHVAITKRGTANVHHTTKPYRAPTEPPPGQDTPPPDDDPPDNVTPLIPFEDR